MPESLFFFFSEPELLWGWGAPQNRSFIYSFFNSFIQLALTYNLGAVLATGFQNDWAESILKEFPF